MADPTPCERIAPTPVPLAPRHDQERPGARLPTPLSGFVGREREIAAVSALLRQDGVRLVTLTGPGGVGKSRLALRVAQELEASFGDGVAFVSLAPIMDPNLVLPTVAQALGVRGAGDRPLADALAAALRDRRLLLVLDNFEQVVAAAPVVADLLGVCPRLTALVTSRAVLRVSGEHAVRVPPLALPDRVRLLPPEELARSEAVRLFAERARAADAGFAVDAGNAAAVAAVCARLDGLPLAIELAAARVTVLPPHAMLDRLQARLPLLTGGARDQPDRLRSMRDAIGWSHDLLPPEEQRLFRRLAVFAGGFALDGAAAVAGDATEPAEAAVLPSIASLVDKSLLQRTPGVDADVRYGMLETVREFALERLNESGEAGEVARRHAAWCLAFAERARRGVRGPRPGLWQDRLAAEFGNLRAALGWALERGEAALGLRLTGALAWYWIGGGHVAEGRRWQERLLAAGDDVPPLVRARGLCLAGQLAQCAGDHGAAVPLLEEALALARRLGEEEAVAEALGKLGLAAEDAGDLDRAVALLDESLARFREVGDAHEIAWALAGLGVTVRQRGDLRRARALLEEAGAAFGGLDCAEGVAWVATGLGELAADEGDSGQAAAHFSEGLGLHGAHRDPWGAEFCLLGLGKLAGATGRPGAAARLLGAAEALREAGSFALTPDHREPHDRCVAVARAALGEAAFAAAWAAGRALPQEEVLAAAAHLAADLAGTATPGAAPSAAEAAGLTAREAEILRLLAEGRSDPEIAAALFLSPRTVQWHVANLLRKLGLPSRAAAAAHAARHGLA